MRLPLFLLTLALSLHSYSMSIDEVIDVCSNLGEVASTIMQARQGSVPMSEVLRAGNEINPDNPVLQLMVYDAYRNPALTVHEDAGTLVQEFRNRWEYFCFSQFISDEF